MISLTLAQASSIVDTALKTGREHKFAPLSVAVLWVAVRVSRRRGTIMEF